MPGLDTMAMRKKMATRGFNDLAMTENSFVSQEAQTIPRKMRRK